MDQTLRADMLSLAHLQDAKQLPCKPASLSTQNCQKVHPHPHAKNLLKAEERKQAILFAATILAARKLNESGMKPWGIHVAITDAIDKAKLILEEIDQRWPSGAGNNQ